MNKLELLEKRNELIESMKSILNNCKIQKRELLKVEDNEFRNIKNQINNIDNQINNQNKTNKNMKQFSLFRNINAIVKGEAIDQNEEKQELRKAGINIADNAIVLPLNNRALTPVGAESAIGTEVDSVKSQLVETSLIKKLGGKVLTNLTSDFVIPSISNASLNWGETASVSAGATVISQTLSPKRLSGYIDVDKKVFLQNESMEAALMDTLYKVVDAKISEALFSTNTGATAPIGLSIAANAVATATGDTLYNKVLKLEAALADNQVDMNTLVYVSKPAGAAVLKSTAKSEKGIYKAIAEDGKIDSYTLAVSAQGAADKLFMLDMSQVYCAIWGIEILPDIYTQAINGKIRLVVNVYADVNISNPAFAKYITLV